jgi:hypothetical protein
VELRVAGHHAVTLGDPVEVGVGDPHASRAVADATDVGEALGSRSVDLRGRIEPIEVLVLRAAAQEPAGS